jgi:hypothetical protein
VAAAAMQEFFIRQIWPILDIPNHRRSYRKLIPICGGVSTFRVERSLFGAARSRIHRYLRVCPCGPAAPLALAPTVFEGRVELSLVYRESCINAGAAQALLDGVCKQLLALLEGGSPNSCRLSHQV